MATRPVVAGLTCAVVLGVLAGTAGCGGDGPAGAGTEGESARASASASQRPSRPYRDGHLTFTLLDLRCGLTAVAGSHSEAQPDGQFCSARLRVDNQDPNFHTYVTARQRLAGVTGPRARPDAFAMAVRRQHEEVEIGGHDLVEVELWYDVPRDARVTGLRVTGDRDPSGYLSTRPADHAPDGVLIRREPRSGP
ncbi:hypothetical protein [Streptomyces longwoodensis]|uniref:hypothetical protein n=1 Tax=Streptomyces longwoodensis TaxID=68231 RepID=UPI000AF96F50|nr:hypothetical protein [Streptomyces longwoodensis]